MARRAAAEVLEGPPTREQARERQRLAREKTQRGVRGRSVNLARVPQHVLRAARAEHAAITDGDDPIERPKRRDECVDAPRPCPFVGCKHHLYLDVNPRTGNIKFNFPDVAPDELELLSETCVLDVAERGDATLNEIGLCMNLVRERVRQMLIVGSAKIRATAEARELRGLPPELPEGLAPPRSGTRVRLNVLQDDDFDAESFASEDLDD